MFISNVMNTAALISAAGSSAANIARRNRERCMHSHDDVCDHCSGQGIKTKKCYCGKDIGINHKHCGDNKCIVSYKTHYYIVHGHDATSDELE